jgi:hypothetical protein
MMVPLKAQPNDFLGRFREAISDPLNLLIERVPMAGFVNGNQVYLHNGNRVPVAGEGAYYGPFSQLLVINRGVHEPLEEYVFQQVLKLLGEAPVMLELGAYWGHYSMWLKKVRPQSTVILVEPDPANLAAGISNLKTNGFAAQKEADVHDALRLRLQDDLMIAVPPTLSAITTYVLLEQKKWFEKEVNFLRGFLKPGMTVIDVGANLGVYGLVSARLVGPEGRVFSYEPGGETRALLEQSRALNSVTNIWRSSVWHFRIAPETDISPSRHRVSCVRSEQTRAASLSALPALTLKIGSATGRPSTSSRSMPRARRNASSLAAVLFFADQSP